MPSSEYNKCKAQFISKHRMLTDFYNTIDQNKSSISANVAKRQFDKYYGEFISAYEKLLQMEEVQEEESDKLQADFSQINEYLLRVEQAHSEGNQAPKIKGNHSDLHAKLPFIELPKFSGVIMDWIPFFDLFQSLVHERHNLSDAEKHYYLRASLVGEALSLVRQLPMDDANYEVALNLLKGRYHNTRLLLDTYIDRILKLPIIQPQSSTLRKDLYDPLRESVQALDKLKMPDKEWSYLILFIILQKLPVRIRSLFEERYGKDQAKLPTLDQLMELLDEQCRLHLTITETESRSLPARRRPTHQQSEATPGHTSQRHSHQVTSNSTECTYCHSSYHSLYVCRKFNALHPKARKSWVYKSGHCFKCMRKHYASECTHRNWCKHCGSKDHNSLLCVNEQQPSPNTGSQETSTPSQAPPTSSIDHRSESGTVSQGQSRNHQVRQKSPINQVQEKPFHINQESTRAGERAARAHLKFQELRYGCRRSPDQFE